MIVEGIGTHGQVFRNCLTMMQPKTRPKELPSPHNVIIYLHNAYIMLMDQIKTVFQISH